MTKNFVSTFILLMGCIQHAITQSNIPIGSWRNHLSYNRSQDVAQSENKIYCAAENGVFIFDTDDNSLTKLSKNEGLTDAGIGTIGYHNDDDLLMVGYINGNIDVLSENTTTNIPTLKNTNFSSNKTLNDIIFSDGFAYIASGFGLVIFDLEKLEIKELVRNLGGEEDAIEVFESTIYNDSIFIATQSGVMATSLSENNNLLDFNNWKVFDASLGIPDTSTKTISTFKNKVYAAIDGDGIYSYDGVSWQLEPALEGLSYNEIASYDDKLLVSLTDKLVTINEAGEATEIDYDDLPQPKSAIIDNSGTVWIADALNGLVSDFEGSFNSYFPDGPYANEIWKLKYINGNIIGLSGGYDDNSLGIGSLSGFYVFNDGDWQNSNPEGQARSNRIPEIKDLVDVEYFDATGKNYYASFANGLLVEDNNGGFSIIDDTTPESPLVNIDPAEEQLQIASTYVDDDGLWVTNHGVNNSLHLLDRDGAWHSYSFGFSTATFPLQVSSTDTGDKWVRLNPSKGGGILVFNPSSGDQRYLTAEPGNGALPSNAVNDLSVDKDGLVWVATDDGVAYFPDPFSVFTQANYEVFIPIFDGGRLFSGERITRIKVDGGNRKWVGTEKGAWLISEDIDDVIYNFNSENSPMLSDKVIDIEIHEKTGEVFFATDKGVVSFRGTATEATQQHEAIKIFPNPVTAGFNGLVGISGLARGVVVKITDISGKLIWQTRSEGGTATWNVADYNGKRAATGIYLVFSSSDDGEETMIGKMAVVN